MVKSISRTIKSSKVIIKNAETGNLIKEETINGKTTKKAVMKNYLKVTNDKDIVSIIVDIKEIEETREMPLSVFLEYSKVVEKNDIKKEESNDYPQPLPKELNPSLRKIIKKNGR